MRDSKPPACALAARIAFRDHHRYTAARSRSACIALLAPTGAAALVTTEKDQVRLGKLASCVPGALPLMTAGLRIEIEERTDAVDWLIDWLTQAPN